MANKSKIASFTIKVNTDNGKVKIDGVTKSFQNAERAYKKLDNTIKNGKTAENLNTMATASTNLKNASGGAAATVTEMGRAISDAPYGIRGVANNLSQLSSQFVNTMRTAGGFTGAMKAMWGAMMGPLGILIGIQAVLAAMEYFSMNTKKTVDILKEFKGAAAQGGSDLKIFKNQVDAGNMSNEELARSLKKVNEEYADLNIQVDDNGYLTDESTKAIDRKIAALERVARAAALQAVIEGELAKQYEAEIELMDAATERRQEFSDDEVKAAQDKATRNKIAAMEAQFNNTDLSSPLSIMANSGNNFSDGLSGREEDAFDSTKQERIIETRLRATKDRIQKIMNMFGDYDMVDELFGNNEKNGGRGKTLKIFKQRFLDLQQVILNNNKVLTMESTRNEVEKLEIQEDFSQKVIDNKLQEFKDKEDIRLKEYLQSIEGHAKEAELTADATTKSQTAIEDAEVEHGEAKMAIRLNYAQKIANKENEIRLALADKGTDADLANSTSIFNQIDPDSFDSAEGYVNYMDPAREERSTFLNDQLAAAQAGGNEMEIFSAQQELNDFNQELREEDIKNELAYYDNKRSIASEYVAFLGQTASLFKALAGDNEKMQKAALIMEKSAATANVLVQTQGAIAARRAGNLMLAASGPQGPAASKLDKVPMAADIARMKVSAGLSIANIWATGWGSKSVKGSGGDNASTGREFDFNLVGSTGQNQLAQATAGQLNQPVQAYVVSSEMTSQQQMDNAIQTNASFGDDD